MATNFFDDEEKIKAENTASYQWGWKYYDRIHLLRNAKSRAYIARDYKSYFRCLHDNYIEILFVLTDGEEKWFDDQFKLAEGLIFCAIGHSQPEQVIAYKKEQKGLTILYDIDKRIMRTMSKHRMIFPKQDILFGFDAVRKRFDLTENEKD